MKPKTLWIIIIKIAGLYIAWQFIAVATQLLSLLQYLFNPNANDSNYILGNIVIVAIALLFYGLLVNACLFKTAWLVDKLRLEEGFNDETIHLDVHRSTVTKIVVILFGGLMIVDGFPTFCRYLLSYFQRKDASYFLVNDPNTPLLLFAFLKTVIGYCLMAYSRMAVNFIERRRRAWYQT